MITSTESKLFETHTDSAPIFVLNFSYEKLCVKVSSTKDCRVSFIKTFSDLRVHGNPRYRRQILRFSERMSNP